MVAQALQKQVESAFIPADVKQVPFDQNLKDTLQLFNQLSDQLTCSYRELEVKVSELQGELVETDRQRIQELTEKEKLADRLESILDVLPAAVITLDATGRVGEANKAAIELLGEPIIGEAWIDIIHRCFSPSPTDGHEIALRNGKLVSIATQSVSNEPGQIIVLNDLTETRQLQQKLNHHHRLSEMGRMTASLAHQVRTPLSTALLYADHLSSDQLEAERRQKYAGKLKERLFQLQSQVNDMLIFSKGGIVVDKKVTMNDLLKRVFNRNLELLERNHVALLLGQEPNDSVILCNQDLLLSACSNLIENSVHALLSCEEEFPRIWLKASTHKGWATLSISDNGPGIPEHLIENVKEPFFTTKSTGTGLGLAVVQAIAQAHGAELYIQQSERGGACIQLRIPVVTETDKIREEMCHA